MKLHDELAEMKAENSMKKENLGDNYVCFKRMQCRSFVCDVQKPSIESKGHGTVEEEDDRGGKVVPLLNLSAMFCLCVHIC